MNTSSLIGDAGYLDFEFNPGNTPFDAGSATIVGFVTNGTLTAAAPNIGAVSGALPGTVTIDNTDADNEYTPGIIFGSFFDVFVTLDIPTVSGTAVGDNLFTLDVEGTSFNSLLSGFPAASIDLNAITGAPTITDNAGGDIGAGAVPEPASFALFGIGGLALMGWTRRSRAARGA